MKSILLTTPADHPRLARTSHPDLAKYSGRRIDEIAHSIGTQPAEVFFEILRKDKLATSTLMHVGNEENVQRMMQHPTHCSGSDAILHGKGYIPEPTGLSQDS